MGEPFTVCHTRFWEHSELVDLAVFSGTMTVIVSLIGLSGLIVGARMTARGVRERDLIEVVMGLLAVLIALMCLGFMAMMGPKAACYVGSL